MHSGEVKTVGGRFGEPSAETLSDSLRALGLQLGRLKTGTPPRIDRTTVDFSQARGSAGRRRPASVLDPHRPPRAAADPLPADLHRRASRTT